MMKKAQGKRREESEWEDDGQMRRMRIFQSVYLSDCICMRLYICCQRILTEKKDAFGGRGRVPVTALEMREYLSRQADLC
jgi:hypothetical protein